MEIKADRADSDLSSKAVMATRAAALADLSKADSGLSNKADMEIKAVGSEDLLKAGRVVLDRSSRAAGLEDLLKADQVGSEDRQCKAAEDPAVSTEVAVCVDRLHKNLY